MVEPPIINEIPQIYYRYREAFGPTVDWDGGVIIAYDGAIYSKKEITEDEMMHEKTHLRQQQEIGLDNWIEKYINEPKFRLKMEIEAYQVQVKHMRSTNLYSQQERLWRVEQMAKHLSGEMYGNIISYTAAKLLLIK